ncbi:MAG: thioester domain-containing protein [Bacillota bacterium]|nr:thioester domain-containing protein [Bacillota bacterium]
MLIRKSRCLRGIVITILAGCMMFVLSAAAFAEESLKDQDIEETNKAYDYTVQTGGDSVGASAGISSGGWASLGSKLSYMKFPEGVSGPDGEDGLWCYCIDISTDTKDGHKYSITSLDAANYYDDDAANKIRTILLNSYPNMTLEELEADYELTELMEEEAFMATQWILWYYSNPDGEVDAGGGNYYPAEIYKPSDYPRETITMWYDDEEGNEVRKSSSNIVKLAKALDALAPAAACETEPADIKFDKIVYDDKVIFDYSSSVGAETLENVKITIKDEQGRDVPFALKGSQVIVKRTELDFPEGTAKLTISLEGVQRLAKDVYFFSPEGGRDASQSRVAAYEGTAPVAKDAVFALTKEEFEEADEDPDKDDSETPTDPADPKEPAGGMGDGELLDPDESPETGDDNGRSVLLWAIIAAMSGATAISVSRRKKA